MWFPTLALLSAALAADGEAAQSDSARRIDRIRDLAARVAARASDPVKPDSARIAGRVILGHGILASTRTQIYVDDGTGGILIFLHERPRTWVATGDSVEIVGELSSFRGAPTIGLGSIRRIDVPPRLVAPVEVNVRRTKTLALSGRLVSLSGRVISTVYRSGGLQLDLSAPFDSMARVTVVQAGASAVDFRLGSHSPGDEMRVVGVLGIHRNADGTTRYQLYPRSADDISAHGLTQRRLTLVLAGLGALALLVIGFFVRERAHAKRKLQRAEETVRSAEAYYQALIENTADAIAIASADGRLLYVSPAFPRMLGCPANDLLDADLFSLAHRDDAEKLKTLFASVSAVAGDRAIAEGRFRDCGEDWLTIEITAANSLENPVVRGIVLNLRDVTDRVRLEHQLRQASRMEAIGQLAGGIAHDFNNLLTVILGTTELILLEPPAPDALRTELQHVHASGRRASDLVRQLLAFSRQQMLRPRAVDLNGLIDGMLPMLRRLIPEDITIVSRLETSEPWVTVDPTQLEQVIINLAVNARDAMTSTGDAACNPTLTITTGIAEVGMRGRYRADMELAPGCYAVVAVSDNGSGMSLSQSSRVFEPFFTTKDVGKGTGLGLSTVYGIVKQSGGHISVTSLENYGSTFTTYLPLDGQPVPRALVGAN
jgi:PAS domain S-box-containing protein